MVHNHSLGFILRWVRKTSSGFIENTVLIIAGFNLPTAHTISFGFVCAIDLHSFPGFQTTAISQKIAEIHSYRDSQNFFWDL
jgi:hypothetical protein